LLAIDRETKIVSDLEAIVEAKAKEKNRAERVGEAIQSLLRLTSTASATTTATGRGVKRALDSSEPRETSSSSSSSGLGLPDLSRLSELTGIAFSRASNHPRPQGLREFSLAGRAMGLIGFSLTFTSRDSSGQIESLRVASIDEAFSAQLAALRAASEAARSPQLFMTGLARFSRFLLARREVFLAVKAACPTVVIPHGPLLSDLLVARGAGVGDVGVVIEWTAEWAEGASLRERLRAWPKVSMAFLRADMDRAVDKFQAAFEALVDKKGVSSAITAMVKLCATK
jgi:hypothetical protein